SESKRAWRVLTGAMRVMDRSWGSDFDPAALDGAVQQALQTGRAGLVDFMGLWLHPKGKAVLAWTPNDEALRAVAEAVARDHRKVGRYPVVAFTTDYELPERFEQSPLDVFRKARESMVVIHLNSGEEATLLTAGLPAATHPALRAEGFTTRFSDRLNRLRSSIASRVRSWRQTISAQGAVAWPIRPNGTLKPEALARLVNGW